MPASVFAYRTSCFDDAHEDNGNNGRRSGSKDVKRKLGYSQGYGDDLDTDISGVRTYRISYGKIVYVDILTEDH